MDYETRLILFEIIGAVVGWIIGGIIVYIYASWFWRRYYKKLNGRK